MTDECQDAAQRAHHAISVPALHVHLTTPIPWDRLAALVAVAVLAVLVVTAVGLLFLRASTRAGELRTE